MGWPPRAAGRTRRALPAAWRHLLTAAIRQCCRPEPRWLLSGEGSLRRIPRRPVSSVLQGNAFSPVCCICSALCTWDLVTVAHRGISGIIGCKARQELCQQQRVSLGSRTVSECATLLKCAVTKNSLANPLKSAVMKLLDLKSFRISTYKKGGAYPLAALAQLGEISSGHAPAGNAPVTDLAFPQPNSAKCHLGLGALAQSPPRRTGGAKDLFHACACEPGRAYTPVAAIRRGPGAGATRRAQVDAPGHAKYNRIESSGAR